MRHLHLVADSIAALAIYVGEFADRERAERAAAARHRASFRLSAARCNDLRRLPEPGQTDISLRRSSLRSRRHARPFRSLLVPILARPDIGCQDQATDELVLLA